MYSTFFYSTQFYIVLHLADYWNFRTRLHHLLTQALEEGANLGVKVSANDFKLDFCMPMKRREVWLANQKEVKFPELWGQFPACARLERFLATNAGRAKILSCIKAGVPLGSDPRNPDVRGIEECHVVIEELQRIKAEKLKPTTPDDTTTTPASGSAQPASGAGGVVPGAGGAVPSDDADGLSFFEGETEDPVGQKASELSLKEMLHINYFPTIEKLLEEIEETVSREPLEQPHPTDLK